MAEPILINSNQETEYNIRPITNLYEFEYGLFNDKFNIYFNDKTDTSNPFLASVEITNSLGEKRWINYKPYTTENVQLDYVDKNKILYRNVFAPNIDVEYEILNGQLKENIILNSPTALRKFEFTLKLSEFVEYELNENGDIIFTDTLTTEELWKIPAPNMVDVNGRESRNLYYSFDNRNGFLSVVINIKDVEFFNSANYPIYIDPTTVYVSSNGSINLGRKPTTRDSLGNIYITFSRIIGSYNRILLRRILTDNTVQYWNGSTFVSSGGTETRIDGNGNFDQFCPSIAIDSLNNIHIVWQGKDLGISGEQIWYRKATYNSGNGTYSWGSQTQLSNGINTKTQNIPHIAIDNFNNIHVVWYGTDNTNTMFDQIKYKRYSNSSWNAWENINVIIDNQFNQSNPYIAIDSQNNIHLIYIGVDYTYTNNQIKYSKLLYNSGNWGSWTNNTGTDLYNNISPISGYTQGSSFIAIDNNDKIHALWNGTDSSTSSFQIKYSFYNGSVWSNWINIQPINGNNQFAPNLVVDNSNNLHVVWRGYDDVNTSKYQVKYSKNIYNGSSWTGWTTWSNLTNGASNTITFDSPTLCYKNGQMDLVYINGNTTTLLYENITPVPPAAPTLLTATIQSSSRILWSWTDNSSDEVNFKLKNTSGTLITANLFLSDGTTPISNGLIPPNTTSIIEKSLSANSSYTRRIVASNDNGDSPYDEESTTTRVLPTFNTFTGTKNGLNNLTWTINKT